MNILDINCRTPVAEIVYKVLSLFNQETFVKKPNIVSKASHLIMEFEHLYLCFKMVVLSHCTT